MADGEPRPESMRAVGVLAGATVVAVVGSAVMILQPPSPTSAWRGVVLICALVGCVFVAVGSRTSAWTVSAFQVRPDTAEFRVGVRPVTVAFPLVVTLLMGAGAAGMTWPAGKARLLWLAFLGIAVFWMIGLLSAPRLGALTPAGLRTSVGFGRVRTYSWDDDLTTPVRHLCTGDVYPAFLRAAVDYYRAFPEFRDRIGDPAEHRRLYAELVAAYARKGLNDVSR